MSAVPDKGPGKVPGRVFGGPGIVLRVAEPGDVRAIAEFQTRCWAEAYRDLVPQEYLDRTGSDEREIRWRRRLRSRAFRVVLAESDGTLVGVASSRRSGVPALPNDLRFPNNLRKLSLFGLTYAPRLELRTLYVDAARRGQGVAQALMAATIGSSPAHLWVFEDNPRARRFYAKHGFIPDGRRKIDRDTGLREIRLTRP